MSAKVTLLVIASRETFAFVSAPSVIFPNNCWPECVSPGVGIILNKLHSPLGLFVAVFIPALILIGFEAWTIKCEFELLVEKKIRAKLSQEASEVIRSYLRMNQTA